MSRRRGFLLVTALLLVSLLLVMGLGIMRRGASQARGQRAARDRAVARALAEGGLEDVVQKLFKDPSFPPGLEGQDRYSYSQDLTSEDGLPLGSYTVTVDRPPLRTPLPHRYSVLATGVHGSRAEPRAVYSLQAVVNPALPQGLESITDATW